MPLYISDPRSRAWIKAQLGLLQGVACEDTLAVGEEGVQFLRLAVVGDLIKFKGVGNAAQSEDSECLSFVAPGEQVPVVTIPAQALGRDVPDFGLMRGGTIVELELAPGKHGLHQRQE